MKVNKILLLGPLWRNRKIVKSLEKKYVTHLSNMKINLAFIKENKINVIITSGYPFKIQEKIIDYVDIAINLHISYLPYGRGIMPNLWSFIENYPPGVTIHKLDKNFDTGDIIIQKKVFFKNIHKHTLKSTHDSLIKIIEKFFLNNFNYIIRNYEKAYPQNKFINYSKYKNRLESDKIMKKIKYNWQTKISDLKKII